jgi:hypothetical protein
MVRRIVWLAPAVAGFLAACAPAPVVRTESFNPPLKPATAAACLNNTTVANTCVAKTFGPWSGFVCPVTVERTANGIVVTPYHLRVPMPPAKVRIVWRLKPPASGDSFDAVNGPTFGSNSEFNLYTATADDDGDVPAASGTRFRVHFRNTFVVPPAGHAYTMIVKGPSGSTACDPVIHNEGG